MKAAPPGRLAISARARASDSRCAASAVAPPRDIDEGQHHAVDAVLRRPVGQHPREKPAPVRVPHLVLRHFEPLDDTLRLGGDFGIGEMMREVRERAADIGRDDIEKRQRGRREALNAKLAIEKNGRDIRRGHQVLQVAVRAAQLLDLELQLLVHRAQFFIDRLHFLAPRFQLLARRTQLLIHRLQLFIARLHLLGLRFALLDIFPQLPLGEIEFRLDLLQHRGVSLHGERFSRRLLARVGLLAFAEDHEQTSGRQLVRGPHAHIHRAPLAVEVHDDPAQIHRRPRLAGLKKRRAQFRPQHRMHDAQQIHRRLAGKLEEAAHALRKVQDFVVLIDEQRRRTEPLDEPEMHFAPRLAERLRRGRRGRRHGDVLGERGRSPDGNHWNVRIRVFASVRARQHGDGRPLHRAARVNAMLLVERGKKHARVIGRFRRAEAEPAFRPQREVENLKRARLRLAVQIDQQIAA